MKQQLFSRRKPPASTPSAPTPPELGPVADQLAALAERVEQECVVRLGFPAATDIDYGPLLPLLRRLVNNLGDPYIDGMLPGHTKSLEREVVAFLADLFGAPPDDRWGYVTPGGAEGNLAGLHLARSLHPDGLVYISQTAHQSMRKAARVLGMPTVTIRATATGQIDTDDLRAVLAQHRHRPAIIAATAGTTMTEAIDDLPAINQMLDELVIQDRFLYVDAALLGIPLALADPELRAGLHLGAGVDALCVSGHKFLGTPLPCGVLVTRSSLQRQVRHRGSYTGSPDTTISGSRSGHAVAMLWYAIARYGRSGLHERAQHARAVAAYALDALTAIGWEAWSSHPLALTLVIKVPPPEVVQRWALPVTGEHTHLVCMPGVTTATIDLFVADLQASLVVSNGRSARTPASDPATAKTTSEAAGR